MADDAVVVFDAKCLACSAWVRFLLRVDRRRQFKYASIQSESGRALVGNAGLSVGALETMLFVEGGRIYRDTDAIVRVLRRVGGFCRIAVVAYLLPGFIRDPIYHWIARNRYRILGERKSCYMPSPEERSLFLD